MTDFRPDIYTNLSIYPGIVEDRDRVDALNEILNELDTLGFGKLVQNFCTQRDPEKASDFLFEISVCQMLRRNPEVQDLQYEPFETRHPPDFRFLLRGVAFDIQVKRLHNIKNEITKRLFERECGRHLSRIPKPWFINFWVADQFTRPHLNPFFSYLKRSLDQFSPTTTQNSVLGEPQYAWQQDGMSLVKFSFKEKRSQEAGIVPGVIYVMATENGLWAAVDTSAFRKGVERLLRKSRPSLARPVSPTQANLLVMQAKDILFADRTMPEALYGTEHVGIHNETDRIDFFRSPNGLFRPGQFSNICGLILVHPEVWCFSEQFKGSYFPHPSHFHNIQHHPKPFEDMTFTILTEWRR